MEQKDQPLVSMSEDDREKVWDDVYVKEEGIVSDYDPTSKTGNVRSLTDGNLYKFDGRELIRAKIELHTGDKVLFCPIENSDGDDHARIIKVMN